MTKTHRTILAIAVLALACVLLVSMLRAGVPIIAYVVLGIVIVSLLASSIWGKGDA